MLQLQVGGIELGARIGGESLVAALQRRGLARHGVFLRGDHAVAFVGAALQLLAGGADRVPLGARLGQLGAQRRHLLLEVSVPAQQSGLEMLHGFQQQPPLCVQVARRGVHGGEVLSVQVEAQARVATGVAGAGRARRAAGGCRHAREMCFVPVPKLTFQKWYCEKRDLFP